jgi:uncharacterized membrane protein YfcA
MPFSLAEQGATLAYSALVLFLAYFVRGMAGFGSGLIAVPLLTLTWPLPVVLPLVVALDYIGSAGQSVRNARHIAWREQLVLVPFMIVGVALGLYVLRAAPAALLARVLGGFVLVYAVYQLLPLPPPRRSRVFAGVCGVLGGLMGTVFGTGGPFYVIYLNLRQLDKTAFRATFASNFLLDGGIRLVAYIVVGLLRVQTLLAVIAALPVVSAALFAGGRLQARFSPRTFRWLISALLMGSGLALLLRR